MNEIYRVRVTQIFPGTLVTNDRKDFDDAAVRELAASIATHGLAQPITLRLMATDPAGAVGGNPLGPLAQFEIVAGERRFRAMRDILQWETVPAIIRELSDEAASAIMLAENTSRADLNPIEEALAYQTRIDRFGWLLGKIAETAGVSVERVKRRLALLSVIAEVQMLVRNGHFPLGHAELLHGLDVNRQCIACRLFREASGMPLATFRGLVGKLKAEQDQDALFSLEEFLTVQVQAAAKLATRGKEAVVNVPVRDDLPAVVLAPTDSTAKVIDRYITTLQAEGMMTEAATLGTVYAALVRGNFLTLPN